MGRQTRFHMLPGDCQRFLNFLEKRDSTIMVSDWQSSKSLQLESVVDPWERGGFYCLWSQAITPELTRETTGQFFNVSSAASVIEFSYPSPAIEDWEGQPSLLQGRIWASFENEDERFHSWYEAAVRWIRKEFIRDPAVGLDRDSIGPEAYEWFKSGGLLLPSFRPPVTDVWSGWVDVQNQHRDYLLSR